MELVKNIECNGIELYFGERPEYKVIEVLKSARFRWHSIKKCWYAKENENTLNIAHSVIKYINKEIDELPKIDAKKVVTKTVENELGVKVGDIFSYSWGYEQTNINYFQVVGLKGKTQVIIREIAYKTTETTGFESYKVAPCKDKFLSKSHFIENNDIGVAKKTQGLKNGTIYIKIESFGFCSLWDGKDDIMTCYY